MDGVTDSIFRSIVYECGPPDVHFTEFVSTEAIARNIPATLQDLSYQKNERPIIAQIYGYEIEAYKIACHKIASLGFDGLDINMGCPAKSVVHSGGGAALIKNCSHAQTIIHTCAKELKQIYEESGKQIPLSVKTRLGHDKSVVKDWVKSLADTESLSNISLHGRTLKQAYSGNADWEAIAQAKEAIKDYPITLLGNGDLQNLEDAILKIKSSKVDGALLGRASYGNPWLFKNKDKIKENFNLNLPISINQEEEISLKEKIRVLLKQAKLLEERKNPKSFIQIRKHTGWMLKGFEGASELRKKTVLVSSYLELEKLLCPYLF